jgi:hypothetical protein
VYEVTAHGEKGRIFILEMPCDFPSTRVGHRAGARPAGVPDEIELTSAPLFLDLRRRPDVHSMNMSLRLFFVLFCALALASRPVPAQVSTASINGTVRDASVGVAPDARVVLRNIRTGIERNTITNAAGTFVFLGSARNLHLGDEQGQVQRGEDRHLYAGGKPDRYL